jgi:hypothetical protein
MYFFIMFFILFMFLIILYQRVFYKNIEKYDNTVSFENVLDNTCALNTNNELDQYHQGDCVVSTCPTETCLQQNGNQNTSPEDLQNGTCVSKQLALPSIYYNCNPVLLETETVSLTPTFSPSSSTATATTSGHATTTSGHATTTSGHATTTSGHATTTSGHAAHSVAVRSTPSISAPSAPPTTSAPTTISATSAPSTAPTMSITIVPSSSTPSEPSYLLTNYAEYKNCGDDEYWNAPNNQCESCNSDEFLKYRRSITHDTACEPNVDCSQQRVKCYVSPLCDVEYKEKILNEDNNSCVLPSNCATSCRRTNVCRLNPRQPCVHPDDGSFERYQYNEDCVLTNVDEDGTIKTVTSCERCRAYVDEETGVTIRRRLRRVGGKIKCVEL